MSPRPDGWPDLLGRWPLSSTDRSRLRAALQDAAPPAPTSSDACYLTIDGLDGISDPAKAIRLRGRIHAAARSAVERRRTIFEATESATTISIYGPDAAERIEGLRAVISHFVVKHGWTLHGSTPESHDTDPEATRIKTVLGTHVATESWRESPNVGKRRLSEQRSSNQIGRPCPNAEIL
ncbi:MULTISPECIES: hypothetical protein [Streptosporangium]|uniref:hypothetical protein n=1 Tax=Streptosporangium TaxID=2000 RepID=UPI00331DF8D8